MSAMDVVAEFFVHRGDEEGAVGGAHGLIKGEGVRVGRRCNMGGGRWGSGL